MPGHNDMRICILCGGELKSLTKEIRSLEVDGHVFVATVPATKCQKCGEGFLDAPTLARFELLVAHRLAESGVRSGAAFRFMRKVAGLTAASLAELLDLAPETLSRWETDKREVDRIAFATLGAIIKDMLEDRTDTLDRLRTLRDPRPLARTVHVEIAA